MNHENWIQHAVEACRHAGIQHETIEIIATWDQQYCANAIYRINGQDYLKIFGPTAERQFHVERAALQTVAHDPAIPAPRIVAERERANMPPYLIISGVAGETAEVIWDDLPRAEQLTLAEEIGTIAAAIHRLPQDDLVEVERQFGGRNERIQELQTRRLVEIEQLETFSPRQREDLVRFVQGEALELLDEGAINLVHYELAHNHIYLARENDTMKVTGFIDWADAILGPPEWDVAYLWFWTFSQDSEAMRHCLQALYADARPPANFARRCLAAAIYTPSMGLLWEDFAKHGISTASIEDEMTAFFFPPDVFGLPE